MISYKVAYLFGVFQGMIHIPVELFVDERVAFCGFIPHPVDCSKQEKHKMNREQRQQHQYQEQHQ
jgi:hypothetical protein